ncbi:hypothetical protein BDZ90DRAFT_257920 [Jaminaea rosea]|uniref:Erg28-like protein n=1 Tax=Jaminaea rosea TaxID=1569628 RepID=A0A316V000_9BASI|nr:hypothetical protein BDZ90DRAFT_257920 [Jaminaea rosea]PWN30866.1 hypothetical protein BDZ90DRAFT_257920 [Jaminaea rosea]
MASNMISSILPPTSQGYLPIWLWIVASTALINGLVNLATPNAPSPSSKGKNATTKANPSHKVYSSPSGSLSSTPLTARLFGTWNILSALVRFACAYQPKNTPVYALCAATFILALVHFGSEAALYGNIDVKKAGSASPFFVAGGSLVWMVAQAQWYAEA